MDSAKCALRLGAEMYMSSTEDQEKKYLQDKKNCLTLKEEGITCKFLASPTRFIGDDQGRIKGIELVTIGTR